MKPNYFKIFFGEEKPLELSTAIGWLLGTDLFYYLPFMVKDGVIDREEAMDILSWSDGYSLQVNVTGSVLDYYVGNIEAICFLDDVVGECMGIKHVNHKNAGEPWGVMMTS